MTGLRHNYRMPRPTYRFNFMWFSRLIAVVAVSLFIGACSMGYYAQAVRGQSELVFHRRNVSTIVSDPATDPKLAARLLLPMPKQTLRACESREMTWKSAACRRIPR
jgi:predicted aminopeptidase